MGVNHHGRGVPPPARGGGGRRGGAAGGGPPPPEPAGGPGARGRARLRGPRAALRPGAPGRSRMIAERIAAAHGARTAERPLASNREFCTYLAEIAGAPVLVTSTGIGGPSTSLAVDELRSEEDTSELQSRLH